MKRNGTIKKGIAWLMTAVMMFSITPVMAEPIQVQAEESQEVTYRLEADIERQGEISKTYRGQKCNKSKRWNDNCAIYIYR